MNDDSGTGVRHAVIARRKKRISIAVLLAATLSGLVILTVASVIAINFTIGRSNTLDLLRDRGELASHAIEAEVRGQLDPAMRQLEFLVDRLAAPDFPIDDKQRVTDLLVGALSGTPQITRLVFASAKRRVTIADQTDDRLNFEVIEQSDNPLMRQSLEIGRAHV